MSPSREPSPRPHISTRASSRSGYGSRAPSRPRYSRASSRASLAYVPAGGESLLLPEGAIGEEATELLQEFVNPHHHHDRVDVDDDEVDDGSDTASLEHIKSLPWYRRPNPWW